MILRKRILKYSVLSAALLFFATAITVPLKYMAVRKAANAPSKIAGLSLTPSENIKTGDMLNVTTVYRCPWGTRPFESEIKTADGVQVSRNPQIRLKKLGWGSLDYEIQGAIQPYRTGAIPESTLNLKFSAGTDKPEIQTEDKIPGFKVSALPVDKDTKLSIAPEIKENTKAGKTYYIIIAALILLALTAGILLYRKKKKIIVRTIWEIALENLNTLKGNLSKGEISPGECLFRLTDIIRDYLEKRLGMHAPRQTTAEFLQDIERPGSPLPDQYRNFLKDFLSAADMVKFAGMPAEGDLLPKAFEKAESLVIETSPKERNGK